MTAYQTVGQRDADFRRLRADGANTVSFDIWWRVPSFWSDTIAPDYAPNPADAGLGLTDTDADLLTASQEARRVGLNVTLTPKFVVGPPPNASGSTWRGDYRPPHPAAFFAGYQSMVDHYADIARQAGMSTLFVGSQMSDSIDFADPWRQIVSSARQHFDGPVGYEVDWRQTTQFSWGDAVDVIMLSAYFPLSSAAHPTLRQLEAGWHSYRYPGQRETQDAFSSVAALAQRWDKPIAFGEVGYPATTYPAKEPWHDPPNRADPQLQYLAYRALLETFVGQSWWGGVMWWAWNDDRARSPESRPAERLVDAQCVTGAGASGAGGLQGALPAGCGTGGVAVSRAHAGTHAPPMGIALGMFVLACGALLGRAGWLTGAVRRPAPAQ